MIQSEQDGAHRRHLAAIKTLATVRKLLTPALLPVDVASRMEKTGPSKFSREGVAGHVPVMN